MNFRQRRKAGLTLVNVLRVLKKLEVTREDLVGVSAGELALEVAGAMLSENPQGWEDIDWDRALEILVKLLEIILRFLPLFLAFL